MGISALQISGGLAALLCAAGAQAQVNPAVKQAARVAPMKPPRDFTQVTLFDRGGNVVVITYRDGPDGKRDIEFWDTNGKLINVLRAAPSSGFGGVVRDHRRPSGSGSPGSAADDGKSDRGSELSGLADWIRTLENRIASLERSR